MEKLIYKTKLAKEKGLTSYLHGFDDEHVYLILEGKEYCHPNSFGGRGLTLPEDGTSSIDLRLSLQRKSIQSI